MKTKYTIEATVTVEIQVSGSIRANCSEDAEENFAENIQDYFFSVYNPEPMNQTDNGMGMVTYVDETVLDVDVHLASELKDVDNVRKTCPPHDQ